MLVIVRIIKPQDVDVLAQLIHGVRYLDIRVGHYPNSERGIWWANHGVFKAAPMQDVVRQVKTFLDNTDEIVIFDVQEFPVGKRLSYNRFILFRRTFECTNSLFLLLFPPILNCMENNFVEST